MLQVTLSTGKVVALRDLSAMEQMNADRASKGDLSALAYYRIPMAVSNIDGTDYPPATSDLQLEVVLDAFPDAAEFNELMDAYTQAFTPAKLVVKDGLVQLSSEKLVLLRKMTAREQKAADACAGNDFALLAYYRVAMAIGSVDGVPYDSPSSNVKATLDGRLSQLSARDFNELLDTYSEAYAPKKADIKNV